MQGMLSCSSSRPALQPAVLSQQGGKLRHGLAKSLTASHQRIVRLPRSRARYQAVRADSGAANDGLGPLQSIANWWKNITGQGTPELELCQISYEQGLLAKISYTDGRFHALKAYCTSQVRLRGMLQALTQTKLPRP